MDQQSEVFRFFHVFPVKKYKEHPGTSRNIQELVSWIGKSGEIQNFALAHWPVPEPWWVGGVPANFAKILAGEVENQNKSSSVLPKPKVELAVRLWFKHLQTVETRNVTYTHPNFQQMGEIKPFFADEGGNM